MKYKLLRVGDTIYRICYKIDGSGLPALAFWIKKDLYVPKTRWERFWDFFIPSVDGVHYWLGEGDFDTYCAHRISDWLNKDVNRQKIMDTFDNG